MTFAPNSMPRGSRTATSPTWTRSCREVDVVYQTRVQKERFATPKTMKTAKGSYVIGAESMRRLSPGAILLHPLPRVDEIAVEVDDDPRAAYFRQAHNGVFIRMALLNEVLRPES